MKHVIEAQQFDRSEIEQLFTLADECEFSTDKPLQGKILASLFYEPSTRTRLSFESAMLRLGGNVITTENAKEFSSAIKGETLEDSIKVVANFADVIVLRHFEVGAALRSAEVSTVPVVNAGDGTGQHPTQALLDLYTLMRELTHIDNIHIAMMGDLKNGRTVRSLCYMLGKFQNIHIELISPPELQIGDDIKEYLRRHNVTFNEREDFEGVIAHVDAVYQTRIQKERFDNENEYLQFKGKYVLDAQNTETMKANAIIMHPLPRVDEINSDLDLLPRAAYFRQVRYGVFIRMALLLKLCS
jgi:aspartate carbamoyltransferase catalytic subunit